MHIVIRWIHCDRCERLAAAATSKAHNDLRLIGVYLYPSRNVALGDARIETFECKACGTMWERDFDPTEGIGYGALLRWPSKARAASTTT